MGITWACSCPVIRGLCLALSQSAAGTLTGPPTIPNKWKPNKDATSFACFHFDPSLLFGFSRQNASFVWIVLLKDAQRDTWEHKKIHVEFSRLASGVEIKRTRKAKLRKGVPKSTNSIFFSRFWTSKEIRGNIKKSMLNFQDWQVGMGGVEIKRTRKDSKLRKWVPKSENSILRGGAGAPGFRSVIGSHNNCYLRLFSLTWENFNPQVNKFSQIIFHRYFAELYTRTPEKNCQMILNRKWHSFDEIVTVVSGTWRRLPMCPQKLPQTSRWAAPTRARIHQKRWKLHFSLHVGHSWR